MRVLILEPYYGGSHRSFVAITKQHSVHDIQAEVLPARWWKWRLSGSPFVFAKAFRERTIKPDLLLFSNTIDVAAFIGLAGIEAARLPKLAFFHENQITYPRSPNDAADAHYGLINLNSALSCDEVWFNSDFHRRSFLEALGPFLEQFPDNIPRDAIGDVSARSRIFPVPVEPPPDVPPAREKGSRLRILWNHRWEFDKAPEVFFAALERLMTEGVSFEVVVLGEGFRTRPPIFDRARAKLGDRVVRYGYADSRQEYAAWVRACDVVVSCARQENFGISIAEAVLAGCVPILPNRLVYPDIIPPEQQAELLYQDEKSLVDKLRAAALDIDVLRHRPRCDFYDGFVAEKVVRLFDAEVERLVAAHRSAQ